MEPEVVSTGHDTPRIQGKILRAMADHSPGMLLAAGEGHHLAMGPGEALTSAWIAAGLELPNLPAMRQYRVDRTVQQLQRLGHDGVLVMDPLNIRYVSDTTNMQVWVMHNGTRYAFVSADGYVVVWEWDNLGFLSGHSEVVDEVRPAIQPSYLLAGPRYAEQARRWATDVVEVIEKHAGKGARIAVDQCTLLGYRELETAGVTLANGQEVMERARAVKGSDEIRAMRCAWHACRDAMGEMREALEPGMTEREVWGKLHGGNIQRAGEWIETQLFSSGPRTNPWFQEASSRVIENGDIVAYDTDLVGAYGMMIDISRSWVAGDKRPTDDQKRIHDMAVRMVRDNAELLTPGRTFRELTFDASSPSLDDYRRYTCLFHGVGQCDEHPVIYFPEAWDEWGYDGVIEPGMVFSSESYIGPRDGREGVKVEDQFLVTDDGPELITDYPLDLVT